MSTSTNPLPREANGTTNPALASTSASKQQAASSESDDPSSSLLTSTNARFCSGIRKDGERCRVRASTGYDFCAFHRPDTREAFIAGRAEGGRAGRYRVRPLEEQIGEHLALRLDSRGGIQGSIDNVLRMLVFGGISPAYANAATRLIAAVLRNLDHTNREAEDHSLDQYLSSISNHVRIQTSMHESESRVAEAAQQRLATQAQENPTLRKAAG